VAAQQQPLPLQFGQVAADRRFGNFQLFGELVDRHLAVAQQFLQNLLGTPRRR
jgi:hypothetical protein